MTYEYVCKNEHKFEERRSVAQRDEPAECPECKAEARRVIAIPSRAFPGADSWRSKNGV